MCAAKQTKSYDTIKRLIFITAFCAQSLLIAQEISFSKDSLYIIPIEFEHADTIWIFNRSDKDLMVEDIRGSNIFLYRLTVNFSDSSNYYYVVFDAQPITFSLTAQDSAQLIFSDPDLCPICASPTGLHPFTDTLTFYSNSITNPKYDIFVSGDGWVNVETESEPIPNYNLSLNYPNPFNPSTFINYSIPPEFSGEFVELNIYSITGELIATLVNEELVAGNYKTLWNGTNSEGKSVSSGVYIYQLKAGAHFVSGKMNLVR
ncbi:MAG: T9SS type A sorting domain-containing protein [Bacteroidetes bacterium]|nr:T9SS type A sorting domain-containing protein [Bacteroidota bacterium]MBU1679691.1 T9SS type A sorting domain-containing protein [Bacteroidota bacterium]MBU2506539.1 T9SS type A sorting domain-containing protein [Bacteroidota bacterium]